MTVLVLDRPKLQKEVVATVAAKEQHFVVFDTETFKNYFLAAFKSVKTGQILTFERGPGVDFDRKKLLSVFRSFTTVGFNSNSYDLVLVFLAIAGFTNEQLKKVSDKIIVQGVKHWQIEREYDIQIPKLDTIDLIEVAPGQASLKIYGGRLHSKRMQDLPVDVNAVLSPQQIAELRNYCINDLDVTELLLKKLLPQIELRAEMSKEYGEELRSKSDAQIAETVIKKQVGKLTGKTPERPSIRAGTTYHYRTPGFVNYKSPVLLAMHKALRESVFEVADSGKVIMPFFLAKAKIEIGNSVYRMGIGGIHSSEEKVAHFADDKTMLVDRDVTSYYPAIILNLGLAPKHIGPDFLKVYRTIVDRRVTAKHRAGEIKKEIDALKKQLVEMGGA